MFYIMNFEHKYKNINKETWDSCFVPSINQRVCLCVKKLQWYLINATPLRVFTIICIIPTIWPNHFAAIMNARQNTVILRRICCYYMLLAILLYHFELWDFDYKVNLLFLMDILFQIVWFFKFLKKCQNTSY